VPYWIAVNDNLVGVGRPVEGVVDHCKLLLALGL
jgi:hypothetical protein